MLEMAKQGALHLYSPLPSASQEGAMALEVKEIWYLPSIALR
jgi:hypothetical protein